MYHVAGTGSTILILYIISYLFYRVGYYSFNFHKKLWNTVLLIAFLVAALAGIFIALQITYKWDIPNVKSILKWHVEFGVGLAVTGILHLLWHLSYFRKIFRNEENREQVNETIPDIGTNASGLNINLFITGFVSTSVQLLLIREMMNISGGYELITGIFLGTWLMASAAGSAIAGKSKLTNIRNINIVFSLSPLLTVFLLFLFARVFMETGETPSLLLSLIYTLIVLLPFCLVSGFTFVRLMSIAKQYSGNLPGKSFSIETTGGIVSGIILPALFAASFGTYKLLFVIISLSIAYTLLTFCIKQGKSNIPVKLLFAILISFLIIIKPDVLSRQLLLPGIKVIASEDTPYGNITRGEYNGEGSIYYNQRLLRYKDDIIEKEEDIHYAMLQHKSPLNVILISGSPDSHIPEILKYHVKKVTYIERDPGLMRSAINDSLKSIVVSSNSDAYNYIMKTSEKTDVVIMLIPPPSTLSLNRYYTAEFFKKIKKILNAGGVFMCSPGTADTYFNDESIRMNSSVYNGLRAVFKNVLPIAGNKLYLIASDNPLSASICKLTAVRGIINSYVSSDYLSDDLIGRRSEEILNLMNPDTRKNTSSFPISYSYFQSYHFSRDRNEKIPLIIIITGLFALPLLLLKRRNMVMYFSASSLAGFEIIALLTLQLIAGNMYQLTGLILAGLMGGLAVGSGTEIRLAKSIPVHFRTLSLMLFYLLIAVTYKSILGIENRFMAISLILFLSFIPAFLTGNIFRETTKDDNNQNSTSSVYSADLSGSALGFIVVSGFAVPILGTTATIYLLGLMVFAGFLFGTITNKH